MCVEIFYKAFQFSSASPQHKNISWTSNTSVGWSTHGSAVESCALLKLSFLQILTQGTGCVRSAEDSAMQTGTQIIKAMLAIQQWAAICCQRNTVLNEMHLGKHYYKGKIWVINLKQWAMEACFMKSLPDCLKTSDMLTEIPERFFTVSWRGGFNPRFIIPKLYQLSLPVKLSF